MGGIGFSTKITRIEGSTGEPTALYDELFQTIADNVRRFAKGKAYLPVLEDYLVYVHEDGYGAEGELSFGFMDGGGGCNMSMHACEHWFELFVSALDHDEPSALAEIAARHGFRIAERPEPLAALLEKCAEPLVELRGQLFATGTYDGKPYITSDDSDETVEFEDLKPRERAKVETALQTQRCECKVCVALRDGSKKLKVPKGPRAKKPPKLKVKTSLYDGTIRNVNDEDCTELPDAVFAPAGLESLNITAPISGLPDAIANLRSLRGLSVTSKHLTRLPAVLTRMPWLRELAIYGAPLETPADLGTLSGLRELHLRGSKSIAARIDEFPFERLKSLEILGLDQLDLARLPEGIGALTALRRLELRWNSLSTLPAAFGALDQLKTLYLDENGFKELPRCLGSLRALEVLTVGNQVETIPSDALAPTLKNLHVSGLKSVPAVIGDLPALEILRLHGAGLRSLPDAIGKLAALEGLDLQQTAIDRLPPSLRRLGKLTFLNLENCGALTELPEWIGELTSLEVLSIKGSGVTKLPESIRTMKKLRSLSLSAPLFPLPEWIGELTALEDIQAYRVELPRGEKARLEKMLPKVRIDN